MFRPAVIILLFCSLQTSGQQRLWKGILLNKNTVEAISNATISCFPDTAESGRDGRFIIQAEPNGRYLKITHPDYYPITVSPPADSSFLTLTASPISGNLLFSDTSLQTQPDSSILKNLNNTITTYKDETYKKERENPFIATQKYPYTAISFSSGHASYNNIRRFLSRKEKVPPSSVRIEEMLNYFPFDDKIPVKNLHQPLQAFADFSRCPWNTSHLLMRIAVESPEMPEIRNKPWNIVLLIDVSGSMYYPDKLPLLQIAFKELVNQLQPQDTLSIVTYTGKAKITLPPTSGEDKAQIMHVIEHLHAEGTTAGGNGIEMAYKLAKKHFNPEGNNLVILATDGDFNVGKSTDQEMKKLILQYNGENINLTCIGVGSGNYKDSKLETLAKWGQGTFIYIDNQTEALRIFSDSAFHKMQVIARDLQLKIIFNPFFISGFRMLGFDSDGKNARHAFDTEEHQPGGVIGPGQRRTIYFEIIPGKTETPDSARSVTLALRYEHQSQNYVQWYTVPLKADSFKNKNPGWRFGASVTLFGMILQQSEYLHTGNYKMVKKITKSAKEAIPREMYSDYLQLLRLAKKSAR